MPAAPSDSAHSSNQEARQNARRRAVLAIVIGAGAIALMILLARSEGTVAKLLPNELVRLGLVCLIPLAAGGMMASLLQSRDSGYEERLTAPAEYTVQGLGPLPTGGDPRQLYIDMVKRTVTNLIYEDRQNWIYDGTGEARVARRFHLDHRVNGEDLPSLAHTMVGIRRLDNLHRCVETILAENVPGDLLEAGVLRGGASIFLRAILKAHGVSDRRVIACDTFRKRESTSLRPAAELGLAILGGLAALPGKKLHRKLFDAMQRMPAEQRSFPVAANPSDELVELAMFVLRNSAHILGNQRDMTSLDAVRSHFARYGLLDDQVLFLQGFFSETLPTAPIERVALLRLDGDTYESTLDVLKPMYPKLSVGGFCIVDDYHAFPDCSRAIDEFRAANGITAELHPIDKMAVYWRKS